RGRSASMRAAGLSALRSERSASASSYGRLRRVVFRVDGSDECADVLAGDVIQEELDHDRSAPAERRIGVRPPGDGVVFEPAPGEEDPPPPALVFYRVR